MTIEVRPMGVACNLACTYCYQEPQRLANGNKAKPYDLDKIIEEVDKTGQNFHVFGGEALMIPKKDLEYLWKYGLEKFGKNGIQTNGSLIDDEHIELFKKYKVHVGVSIDGANDLNALREGRGKQNTQELTQKTMDNLVKLKNNKIAVGVIITLHRVNGIGENLDRLLNFIKWLGEIGITGGNIHTLEVDSTMPDQEKHVLSQKENAEAFVKIAQFMDENPQLNWAPFNTIPKLIMGDMSQINCVWNRCDPMNTQAVYGIEGDGGLSNCGRTNKEGIDFYKANGHNYSRYISLYHTPQNMGGCKGCKYFLVCGGSCPGESQQGDFRNKTMHCHTQKKLIGYYEEKLIAEGKEPITNSEILPMLEEITLHELAQGNNLSLAGAIRRLEQTKKEIIQIPVKEGEE